MLAHTYMAAPLNSYAFEPVVPIENRRMVTP